MNEHDNCLIKILIFFTLAFFVISFFYIKKNSKISDIDGSAQNEEVSSFVRRENSKKMLHNKKKPPFYLKSRDQVKSGQGETLKLKLWGLKIWLFPFSEIELRKIPEFSTIFSKKVIEVYGHEVTLCVRKDGVEKFVYEDDFVIAGSVTTMFFIKKTSEYTQIISLEGEVAVGAKKRDWKGKADERNKVVVYKSRAPERIELDMEERMFWLEKIGYEGLLSTALLRKNNFLIDFFRELMFEKSVLKQYMRTLEMAQWAYFLQEGEVFADSLNELQEKFNALTIPKSMDVQIDALGNDYKIEIGLRNYVYVRGLGGEKMFFDR